MFHSKLKYRDTFLAVVKNSETNKNKGFYMPSCLLTKLKNFLSVAEILGQNYAPDFSAVLTPRLRIMGVGI